MRGLLVLQRHDARRRRLFVVRADRASGVSAGGVGEGCSLQGGGIDVIQRIARANGIAVRVVNEGSWDNAQLAVREGRADAIVGIYETPARKVYFDYVNPPLAPDPSSVLILPASRSTTSTGTA